jgi:nucleotide-binding universal stress UspA family protein
MRWLITTDGTSHAQRAAHFAASLLRPGQDQVVLLGITSRNDWQAMQRALEEIENNFPGLVTERIVQEGPLVKVIENVAFSKPFDLAVYASRGRRGLKKMILGSVAAKLALEMPCSVLVIRQIPKSIKKMLIASTLSAEHHQPVREGMRLAALTGASITLLHVMSQIPLADQEYAGQLELKAEEAIAQHTREGLRFEKMLEYAVEFGVEVNLLIRYGLVEDEIINEVGTGDYDLLVMGAHRATVGHGWENLLIEDVASTVLIDTRCPVLIVRK